MMSIHGVHVGAHIVRNGKRVRGYPHVALVQVARTRGDQPATGPTTTRDLRTRRILKERKSKPTLQERIAKPTSTPSRPRSRTPAAMTKPSKWLACSINGWALTEDETLAWLKIYNAKCQPPWTDKELEHKAKDAAKAKHEKPRGHLLNASIAEQRAEPDWTLPTKPHR